MVSNSPNVATNSASHCPAAAASVERDLPDRQFEHQVRDPHADDPTDNLCGDVRPRIRPPQLAAEREREAHRRVEMRARERAERENENGEDRAGRQRVAQQRQRVVTAGKALRHDAGADDRGEQEGGAQTLGDAARRSDGIRGGRCL